MKSELAAIARRARLASRVLQQTSTDQRNAFLTQLERRVIDRSAELETANALDLDRGKSNGLTNAVLDRLSLKGRTGSLAQNAKDVRQLPDPLAAMGEQRLLANGMKLEQRRVPLGVVLMIFEARPNATVEAAVLAIKSGNAIILKGGKEAEASNTCLGLIMADCLREVGLPEHAIQVVTLGHEDTLHLLGCADDIDLCVPRGGEKLISAVRANAKMPVLAHGPGVCHVFVDSSAPLDQAIAITLNSKLNRPATCNSAECLLVHQNIAAAFLPAFAKEYLAQGGELRGCEQTLALLPPHAQVKAATAEDFGREYLDRVLAVKIVDGMDAAMAHIAEFGTHHTEVIVTDSLHNAEIFCQRVDASAVFVNASTRLNDGGSLGLGAELGISTSKFHAYGPMGLASLTMTRTVGIGHGQLRR